MKRFALRAGVLATAMAMLVFCVRNLNVETDISSFIPRGGDNLLLAALSNKLSDSELSRTMILTIAGPDTSASTAAARALSERLAEHPDVSWVRSGLDPDQLEGLYRLYFPRRHAFLAEDPSALGEVLSDAGLRERAQRLRRELARPSGGLAKRFAAEDPLLAFPGILERFRASEQSLALRDGIFVTDDERWAVVLLATHARAFETARQEALHTFIDEELAAIGKTLGAPLHLESSGIGRFAVRIQGEIFRDIRWIIILSSLGVTVLFLLFLRSLSSFFAAAMPHVGGVLVATTVGLLIFERLDGMAVAFGIALVGVSIDYAVHIITHHALEPEPVGGASATARKLRPSLVLGAATTVASFIGLAFTTFPGFRQMGVMAAVGVTAALCISLWIVPDLLGPMRAPPLAHRTAKALERAVHSLRGARRPLAALTLGFVLFGVWGAPRLQWIDDPRTLTVLPADLVAEEDRVRGRVARYDAGRFAMAIGENAEAALAANDRVAARLEELVEGGQLGGFRSLHSVLWSASAQQANLDAVHRDPQLAERVEREFSEAGFRPGAFRAFADDLASPAPAPLRLDDLRESALADLVGALVFDFDDGRVAIATYLSGVQDPQALEAALAGLEGVAFFDQAEFLQDVYGSYRARTVAVVALGTSLVLGLLLLRYRRWRPALAAFLPSGLVAFGLCGIAALVEMPVNLLHVMGLVLVMGMGVDYGIFVVDTIERDGGLATTLLGLFIACLTTIFIFGLLGISTHPALNAIGLTAGAGVALNFLLAPVALVLMGHAGEPKGAESTRNVSHERDQ